MWQKQLNIHASSSSLRVTNSRKCAGRVVFNGPKEPDASALRLIDVLPISRNSLVSGYCSRPTDLATPSQSDDDLFRLFLLLVRIEIHLVFVQHLVRVGLFGHVGRFSSSEGVRFARRSSVICRTTRGLEVGEVLANEEANGCEADGVILRRVTVEDQLILARLDKYKDRAFRACEKLLRDRNLPAVLMDVEHLFDGRALYFYFLGEVTPEVDALTSELAAAYDTEVQFHRFAQTLTEGCGPGCGTEEATGSGCGSGGCASCAVAGACSPRGGR